MKKLYPYLDNPYINNINEQGERRTFLQQIDNFINQKQYVRITLLDWNENGLKEIQGELTSGSIAKDGSSAVRRTCNFACSVNAGDYDIENADMDFAINKKIFVEVGIKNYTKQYPEYPILWFPQGVFYISQVNITASANSATNISLQLKDKMAGLNGDVGGMFPTTTVLDSMDTQLPTGEYVTEKVLIYNLITEMVNHIGGEQLQNIVIEDVPLRIRTFMRWLGDNPLYMSQTFDEGANSYQTSLEEKPGWDMYITGEDVGYIYSDFVYTGELVAAPGDTVTNMLDQLVNFLGNFEYFYDEFGVFHFREIKNYYQTTQTTTILENIANHKNIGEDYLVDITNGKSNYTFSDDSNLTNITVNPQYANIKNDYFVQGLRKSVNTDITRPVIYHLAIDEKPIVGNIYKDLAIYESPFDGYIKAVFPLHEDELPEVGNFNVYYMLNDDASKLYYWSNDNTGWAFVEPLQYYPPDVNDNEAYIPKDWRTELYLQGMLANNLATSAATYYSKLENSYGQLTSSEIESDKKWIEDIYDSMNQQKADVDFYYTELQSFWPQMYDLEKQCWIAETTDQKRWHSSFAEGNYYLDFIEPTADGLGEFCVSNIGRRSQNVYNEDLNCLFEPEVPDVIFINIDDENAAELVQECKDEGADYAQVPGEIYCGFGIGGYHNPCFDEMKYQLFLHTTYARNLTLTALPAFYLEPNTRVTINDKTTNTYGDFMVKSVSISFGAGNLMSVTATECNMDRLQ